MSALKIKDDQGNWINLPGLKGDKGDKGDKGESGVYLGTTAPSDEDINVWINPNGEAHTEAVVIDDTLSVEGQAADAKAVGDKIGNLKADLTSRFNFLALEQGTFNINSGKPNDTSNYVRTISKIEHPAHIKTDNTDILVAGVFTYNVNDDTFVSYTAILNSSSVDVSPEVGTYVRLTFKRRDSTAITPYDIQPDLTITNLVLKSYDTDSNTLALMGTSDITDLFIKGGIINTGVSVGTLVDITPVSNAGYAYIIKPCRYGDKFTLTGTGGTVGRLWCFTDQNYRSKNTSTSNATGSNLDLIAPANGYLIVNASIANGYSLKATQRVSSADIIEEMHKNYTHITNPHYLFWRMGAFDVNGAQGFSGRMLAKDRFFTIVKVKAGSKVSKKGTRTKTISFGYKLSESDAALTDYTPNAGDSITIQQDCIAYIGIRYGNPVADLLNDTILDEFDFDLMVVDYKSRYSRGEGVKDVFAPANGYAFARNYGTPCPEIYYEGQHTDTTGWTNSFSDIDAIHNAFDALVASSESYLVKKNDYGVAYTGNAGNTDYDASSEWHLYEYATVPINASVDSVPKVAITCTMHGNEKMSAYAMHYLMYDLIHNADKNPVLSWLKANCIITFIPICNPYGFMKPIPSRLNENGVNLNRNFPTYNWDEWEDTRTNGYGSEPGGLNYKGESAASESETQMMMQFYRNNYDAVFAIDLHTNGADTVTRDMVSAYMRALPQDTSDLNYQLLNGFLSSGKTFTNRIRPWLNGKYNAGISYSMAIGTTNPIDYYPCAPHWVRETAGLIGVCYEVLAGSSNGFLGEQLTVYSPASIKAAAENLGNFIVAMVAHCKNLT